MLNLLAAEINPVLTPTDRSRTLIITVGNELRSDDGVGPYIAKTTKQLKEGFTLLDAGDKPENIIEPAIDHRPAKVIFIDAADWGGQPGEARLINEASIPQTTLTTHAFPLPIMAKLLEAETGATVYFIGIQPATVAFGEQLSSAVLATAKELIFLISHKE